MFVALDDSEFDADVVSRVSEVVRRHPATPILIDIPIGLRSGGREERLCDLEARRALGAPRGSSLFPVPCRPALCAESYEAASALNLELTGRKLSKQSWAIGPKIREVDALMRENGEARSVIRDSHPEVIFWALNGGRPMSLSKRDPMGARERLTVLERHVPNATGIVESVASRYRRSELAPDDVIDALALGVAARTGTLATLPEDPELDEFDLPMEIAYPPFARAGRPQAPPRMA